jgi:hypothetical protein
MKWDFHAKLYKGKPHADLFCCAFSLSHGYMEKRKAEITVLPPENL